MNPMVPGLAGGKMSSSDDSSKIDLLDSPTLVKQKLRKALCVPKETANNGVISFIEYVLFPISELANGGKGTGKFEVTREEKFGGDVTYTSMEDLKRDYEEDKLFPADLKRGLEDALNALLEPIRKEFEGNEAWKEVEAKAYPTEVKTKKKKEKKIGTGYVAKKKGGETVGAEVAGPVEGVKSVEEAVGTGVKEVVERLKKN